MEHESSKKKLFSPPPEPSFVLRSFESGVTCVHYSIIDNKSFLYAADQIGLVYLYNLHLRTNIFKFQAHENNESIFGLSLFSQNKNNFVTLGKDGFVKVWDLDKSINKTPIWTYQLNHCSFCNCDITQNLIVVPLKESSTVGTLDYRLSSSVIVQKFSPSNKCGMVMKLHVLNDKWLFIAYENGLLAVYNLINSQPIAEINVIENKDEPLMAMDVCSFVDNQKTNDDDNDEFIIATCLCGTSLNEIYSIEFIEQKKLNQFSLRKQDKTKFHLLLPNNGCNVIKYRQDSKLFALSSWDSRIRLYRRHNGKQLVMFDYHHQHVNCIDFSPNTFQMACGSNDRTVSIWDIYNRKME
ncbi:unnamed protein product [Didymodactylos carnosus]|uniref:Uncharacterized protein n=1 Tax=Didymodactylos carnosus TaxID=1234261 RepID=A0A813W1V5_9BILA|nr:unnamed protein product [Didymodactylos carnosus]CAF3642072.1 unnamed protein product [Didymodactylos carnosus]